MQVFSTLLGEFSRLRPLLRNYRASSITCLNSQRAMWGRLRSLHGVEGDPNSVELDSMQDVLSQVVTEQDADKQNSMETLAGQITRDHFVYNLCIANTQKDKAHPELTDILDILTRREAKDCINDEFAPKQIRDLAIDFSTLGSAILWTINLNTLRQLEKMELEDGASEDFGEALEDRYTSDANVAVFSPNADDEFDRELEAKLEEYKSALLAVHLCNQISTILMSFLEL